MFVRASLNNCLFCHNPTNLTNLGLVKPNIETVFPTSFDLAAAFKGYLYLSNLQKISLFDVINKSEADPGPPKHLRILYEKS